MSSSSRQKPAITSSSSSSLPTASTSFGFGDHLALLRTYANETSSGAPPSLRALVAASSSSSSSLSSRSGPAPVMTDKDALLLSHEFLPSTSSSASASTAAGGGAEYTSEGQKAWSVRLAEKYWAKLYKEFALADLSRYREGKVGLRWRTEGEVVSGKGQFICANLTCDRAMGLNSYETPFRYVERGETKEALVKVRLCGPCAARMFAKELAAKVKETEKEQGVQAHAAAAAVGSAPSGKQGERSALHSSSRGAGGGGDGRARSRSRSREGREGGSGRRKDDEQDAERGREKKEGERR